MANKFTKSVLERQAKELQSQRSAGKKTTAPEEPAVSAPKVEIEPPAETPVISVPAPEIKTAQPEEPAAKAPVTDSLVEVETAKKVDFSEPAPVTAPVKKAAAQPKTEPAPVAMDISAFIIRDEGRSAKNKTFYLDEVVINALHRAAVAQKVTDSKLVNDILKKILNV